MATREIAQTARVSALPARFSRSKSQYRQFRCGPIIWREISIMPRRRKAQTGSSFQAALAVANSEGYLGNAEVVESLVRDFVANSLEATGPESIYADCDRLSLIFSGNDEGFTPIPEWNTREGLGMKCCERHDLDPNMSLVDILRATFAMYAAQARGILIEHAKDPEEDWGWKIDQIIEHCTSLMLGTIDTLYPQPPE